MPLKKLAVEGMTNFRLIGASLCGTALLLSAAQIVGTTARRGGAERSPRSAPATPRSSASARPSRRSSTASRARETRSPSASSPASRVGPRRSSRSSSRSRRSSPRRRSRTSAPSATDGGARRRGGLAGLPRRNGGRGRRRLRRRRGAPPPRHLDAARPLHRLHRRPRPLPPRPERPERWPRAPPAPRSSPFSRRGATSSSASWSSRRARFSSRRSSPTTRRTRRSSRRSTTRRSARRTGRGGSARRSRTAPSSSSASRRSSCRSSLLVLGVAPRPLPRRRAPGGRRGWASSSILLTTAPLAHLAFGRPRLLGGGLGAGGYVGDVLGSLLVSALNGPGAAILLVAGLLIGVAARHVPLPRDGDVGRDAARLRVVARLPPRAPPREGAGARRSSFAATS